MQARGEHANSGQRETRRLRLKPRRILPVRPQCLFSPVFCPGVNVQMSFPLRWPVPEFIFLIVSNKHQRGQIQKATWNVSPDHLEFFHLSVREKEQ